MDLARLAEPFPADQIHWRAQNLKADGSAALALAYLDARDVMDRLDEICGPSNWQDRYEFHGERTICYLSIRIGDEWITKADGGGDTDIEGEKGAISGALKRAGVKWGIGRYLYDLGNTWVPCETYRRKDGKPAWKRWSVDPWSKVRDAARFLPAGAARPKPQLVQTEADKNASEVANVLIASLEFARSMDTLTAWKREEWVHIKPLPEPEYERVVAAYKAREAELLADEPVNMLEAG